jgi:hypothetical protein
VSDYSEQDLVVSDQKRPQILRGLEHQAQRFVSEPCKSEELQNQVFAFDLSQLIDCSKFDLTVGNRRRLLLLDLLLLLKMRLFVLYHSLIL